jgi:hypothetical protein
VIVCVHPPLTMLVSEDNPGYFRRAYVDRKGDDYDYPVQCDDCHESIVIEK